jgi:hypothetical protein
MADEYIKESILGALDGIFSELRYPYRVTQFGQQGYSKAWDITLNDQPFCQIMWDGRKLTTYPQHPLNSPEKESLEGLEMALQKQVRDWYQWKEMLKTGETTKKKDSGHYNYPRDERKKIAMLFRDERRVGRISNKAAWAKLHGLASKTLDRYLDEFPEGET